MKRSTNAQRVAEFLDPVRAARTRIATCERYRLEVDPRDTAIVAEDEALAARNALVTRTTGGR